MKDIKGGGGDESQGLEMRLNEGENNGVGGMRKDHGRVGQSWRDPWMYPAPSA